MSQKVFFKGWTDFRNVDFQNVVPTWYIGDIDIIDSAQATGSRTISNIKIDFQVQGIDDYNPDYACPVIVIICIKNGQMVPNLKPANPLSQRYIDYSAIPQQFVVCQGLINHKDKAVINFNGKIKLNSNQTLTAVFTPISIWYARVGSGTPEDPYIYDFVHHNFSIYFCGEYTATY